MHSNNIHKEGYNFNKLLKFSSNLKKHTITKENGDISIDFSNNEAVYNLNKALLLSEYNIADWFIPEGYLCSPVPGRADYIHILNDLINKETEVKGLDIGVGANCIYPLLASQIFGWDMVGCDINLNSVKIAKENLLLAKTLKANIEIVHQENPSNIFTDIIKSSDYFEFTMCNPPFFNSEEDYLKASNRKNKNLNLNNNTNFSGLSNELWCNGGEALFIKRMIKESVKFKSQVNWFTSLVSNKSTLPKLEKQLLKLKAKYEIVAMDTKNKKSRILAWTFN